MSNRKTNRFIGRRARGYLRTVGWYGRFSKRPGVNLPERKFFDEATGSTNISATGTITPSINLVPQGNGESAMVGRKITIKRISFRTVITLPSDAQSGVGTIAAYFPIRILILQDTQCNGAAATVGNVLESQNYASFMNLENRNRFRILKEFNFNLLRDLHFNNAAQVYFAGFCQIGLKWSKKVNIPIEFSPEGMAGTRDISEVRSNNIFILSIAGSVNNVATFNHRTRIRYTDD